MLLTKLSLALKRDKAKLLRIKDFKAAI